MAEVKEFSGKFQVNVPVSVEEYLRTLQNGSPCVDQTVALSENGEYAKAMQTFIRSKRLPVWTKKKYVKVILSDFCKQTATEIKKLRFPLFDKDGAYMTDGGTLSLSLLLLHRSSPVRIVKLLLHELGHFLLKQTENYPALLALDRAYLKIFGANGNQKAASPVELYATLFSVSLAEQTARLCKDCGDELEKIAKEEKEKLTSAVQTLPRL